MFLHQREGLRGGKGSMLDRIDPGADGGLDRARRVDVRGHLQAERMGRLDRDTHLVIGH